VAETAQRQDAMRAGGVPLELADDLSRVERRLREELLSREPRLEEIAWHLVGAGGKRLRPLVVLLAFRAAAAAGSLARLEDAIEAAVALELIHSATLLHDDIIDGNETRRGRPSALARFGTADTLVGGDFLFCRAFALCARFEADVIRWAGDACVTLTEGEILQARFRRNPAVTLADYHEIVARKTAVLFSTGARTAAHLAGGDATLVAAMHECGHRLGVAFQMQDDLLDVTGETTVIGKPRGLDLRDGNPSLPIVLAMPRVPELARLFAIDDPSPADVETGLARIRASGVLDDIRRLIRTETDAAVALLAHLPPTDAREALLAIVAQLDSRTH
jgi:octaprenyl-diphosphate synthase